jgi:hypothetical protein
MNGKKEAIDLGKRSWSAEKSLGPMSIALGTLIASAEYVFASTTALLVGD